MENFKINEYFKDYAAIQKEYFSDLRQVTEPKEVGGRLESTVLFNGEGYKKIERITDDSIYILLVPNENLQVLPVVEFTATKELISIETYKIINKNVLEHTTYISLLKKDTDSLIANLVTKYFDVSDEINNDRYVLKYGMQLELGKGITKKLIGKSNIFAKRNMKSTLYYSSPSKIMTSNEPFSLFELLKTVSKQEQTKNKTK